MPTERIEGGVNFIILDDAQSDGPTPEQAARIRDWYERLKREGRITERAASTPDGTVTFVFIQGDTDG